MTVTRVDQSPMNEQRWCLTLECGHEQWVTAKRRPRTRKSVCPKGCVGTDKREG